MQPIPYIFFRNDARAAFTLYGEVFGAEPEIMEMGDAMPGVDPKTVMHAAVKVGDGWIYGSDDPSGSDVAAMAGCNVHVSFPTVDEARRVFDALSEGGDVRMPLEKTFWSPAFGAFSDKFGTRWMISADAPES
ncbi:VOC family protein [Maritimibacter sp. UBA3975]|uniref:VOC family protein n=1 Tax=Maritimibacter sp. UBA3975 TaxID=1946833 RepID=UPI000C09F3F8|nr:VOC family protein [Maritimibacter sp. UBA3975]MAM60426.1 VOC family protein [Maritimibacter sp.]|tara:strand:+ start:25498 stop:25896 length:399 start_codon:yes stop_codon:yes gene_type:complete